jgi:hypothetical protein
VHDHQALRTHAKATRVTKRATTPLRAVDTCGRGWTVVPRPGRIQPGKQTRVPVNLQLGWGFTGWSHQPRVRGWAGRGPEQPGTNLDLVYTLIDERAFPVRTLRPIC